VVLEPVVPEVDERVFNLLWREPTDTDEPTGTGAGAETDPSAPDPSALSRSRAVETEAEAEAAVVQMMSRHYIEAVGLEEPKPAEDAATSSAAGSAAATAALAVRLIDTAFHLLFLPAFTTSEAALEAGGQLRYARADGFAMTHVWNKGVGTREQAQCAPTDYDAQRVEVLRLLSTLFCDAIYQKPRSYDVCRSLWLEAATGAEAPWVPVVLCSLLNSVLGYDPVGWGVPYSNLVAADSAGDVMKGSLHVLLVLLDYGLPMSQVLQQQVLQEQSVGDGSEAEGPSNCDNTDGAESAAAATARMRQCENTIGFNSFRRLLATVHAPADLGFIFDGLMRLLTHMHYYYTTVFAPGSASVLSSLALSSSSYTPLTCDEEVVLLLWRCLQEIPTLLTYMLEERAAEAADLVAILINSMLLHRRTPARANHVYLCTFILLRLSADRSFAVLMNQPYNDADGRVAGSGRLRCVCAASEVPLFYGSYMDLLALGLARMVATGSAQAPNMAQCWLTILSNVSPYCKALCVVTAMKLGSLVEMMAVPEYLAAHELNYIHLVLLLETFNNIVQYQYDGNSSVVYVLLRVENCVRRLATMQYSDLRGSQMQTRVETATATATDTDSGAATDSGTGPVAAAAAVTTDGGTADAGGGTLPQRTRTPERGVHSLPSPAPTWLTPSWFAGVMTELPLFTLISLLDSLLPRILSHINKTNRCEIATDPLAHEAESLFDRISGHCSEIQIYNYIRATTLVGLLPRPHSIVVRPFITAPGICSWISIYTHSVVVIALQDSDLPPYDFDKISLFTMRELAGLSSGACGDRDVDVEGAASSHALLVHTDDDDDEDEEGDSSDADTDSAQAERAPARTDAQNVMQRS